MPITFQSTHVPWSKHHGLLDLSGVVIHPIMGILTMRTHAWDKSMVNMDCAAHVNGLRTSDRLVSFHRFEMINHKMTKDAETSQRISGAMSLGCQLRHGKITWDISRERGAQAPGAPRRRQNPTRNGYRLYKWFLQMNRQWVIGRYW